MFIFPTIFDIKLIIFFTKKVYKFDLYTLVCLIMDLTYQMFSNKI